MQSTENGSIEAQTPTPPVSEDPSGISQSEPTPTPIPPATPAVRAAVRLPSGLRRPAPSPVSTLVANLQDLDVEAVEAVVVGVREAWQGGDQSAIVDALLAQATLLETLGTKLLRIAGAEKNMKAIHGYGNLALRALEQARKTLATVAGLHQKPRTQNNVQINVGGPGPAKEVSGVVHGE